ncbi:MAG: DUF4013 domain-containing protein [Anaerolineae bacterium]|nr:DUF4013 domain-containing protein [Anaerolineae bacterium]
MTTQSLTTDQLQALLAFPFKDENWKNKFLIGSLVVLAGFVIPIIPFAFVYGYMVRIMRGIIVAKAEPHLPEWDDWGQLLVDGFKLFGVVLIYMLPIILLYFIGFGLTFLGPLLSGLGMAMAGEDGGETVGMAMGVVTMLSLIGSFVVWGVTMLLALTIGMVMPAIFGHVVATDEFGAAFRIKEWWAIFRANLGGFLIAYLVIMLASMVLSSVLTLLYCTVILCCLTPVITAPITMYLTVIYGAIFGQAYRGGVEKLASQTNLAGT